MFSHQEKRKIDRAQEVIVVEKVDMLIRGILKFYLAIHLHIHLIQDLPVDQAPVHRRDLQSHHLPSAIHIAIILKNSKPMKIKKYQSNSKVKNRNSDL